MKKCTRLLALLLTFVMVFALAASSAEAAPKTYSLKIAHVNSQTHPAHIALEKFKEIVEEKTDGAVKVDIYDSSVLGGELEEIQQAYEEKRLSRAGAQQMRENVYLMQADLEDFV